MSKNQKEIEVLRRILDRIETVEGLMFSINQLLSLTRWEIEEAIKRFQKEEKK